MDSDNIQISKLLVELPLFKDLDPQEMDIIQPLLKIRTFKKYSVLYEEGDDSSFFGVILSGFVEIYKEAEHHAQEKIIQLTTGRLIGEIEMFDGVERTETAKARQYTQIIILTKHDFDEILQNHHLLALKLLKRIAGTISNHLMNADAMIADLKEENESLKKQLKAQ